MILQLINETGVLVLALGTGIYAYPYMNKFTRMLFFQLVVWFLFFLASYAIIYYQRAKGLEENNQALFNLYGPVELVMLLFAALHILTDKISKWLAMVLYIIYAGTFTLQLAFSGLSVLANYAIAVSGFVITVFYTLMLYKKFKSDPSSWRYSPEVWASLGLIVYAACNVPYFSLFHYLNHYYPELSSKLYNLIADVLANIRYLLMFVAFWLTRKNRDILFSKAI